MSTKEYEVTEKVQTKVKVTEVYCDKCGDGIIAYKGDKKPKGDSFNYMGDWQREFHGTLVCATLCKKCAKEADEVLDRAFLEAVTKLGVTTTVFVGGVMGILRLQCKDGKLQHYKED